MNRARRLAHLPRPVIGALALCVGSLAVVVVFSGIFRAPFRDEATTVRVDFPRAPQLSEGDQVRIDGNIEGRVSDLEAGAGGVGVTATLALGAEAGPIYADASARLRVKTLLAGAFYVDLDRGTRESGALGDATIPARRTAQAVEIEDISDVFRGDGVEGLHTLPRESARALDDPEALAGALDSFVDVAPDARAALSAARGRRAGVDLPALVKSTSRAVRALDAPRDRLRILVSGAATTVQTTAGRADEIRRVERSGGAATAEMRRTLSRLDSTLAVTDRLVGRLRDPLEDAAPTLAAVRPTAGRAAALLEDARPLLRDLRPAVDRLADVGRLGVPFVESLRPALRRTDETILPGLARDDPGTGKPTSTMIGGFAAGFGGSAAQQDRNGHFIRFPATVGASSVYLPCRSQIVDPDAPSALACDRLGTAFENYLGYVAPLSQTPDAAKGGRP